ncbi:MAG: hypothetical protein HY940_03940 [Gammaproteobacteria bacterium]|nr:hypothetical protein [Gammaproteobacteria bacterium]
MQSKSMYSTSIAWLLGLSVLLFGAHAQAAPQFTYTLAPNPDGVAMAGSGNLTGGVASGNDGTRLTIEKVQIDNVVYMHTIVSEAYTGFATEYYTRLTQVGQSLQSSPDSGGNERALMGSKAAYPVAAAGYAGGVFGNAKDPYGLSVTTAGFRPYDLSGVGTGDPTKMTMRTYVSDSGMTLDVLKPLLTKKPVISQTVKDGALSLEYKADLRRLNYTDSSRAGDVRNATTILDSSLPTTSAGAGNFDMAFAQQSVVTAGRYSFAPGTGWNSANGWDVDNSRFTEGVYSYAAGGFDVLSLNWAGFFDYQQNKVACATGHRTLTVCPP